MSDTALITGAGGAIGRPLLHFLRERAYRVRILLRPDSQIADLPADVEVVRGDITDAAAVRTASAGIDRVFHLAAKLHVNNPPASLRDEYWRVNVEGTRVVAEAARTMGVRRLVYFSTINVYGPSLDAHVITEESELRPESIYAETKAEAERIALGTGGAVVLRLAAVYGPGMKGNYPRLLNALRRRRFVMVGAGQNRRTLVYVADACRAAVTAAEHPEAVGEVFNVTDGAIHTLRQIVDTMSAALGRRPPRLRLPVAPVRGALGMVEGVMGLFGKKSPIGRATLEKFTEDIAVSGAKLHSRLGYRPEYPLERGWRETLAQTS